MLTDNRHADIAQALGLVASTSRANQVRYTMRRMSIVGTPSSASPCPPYQRAADEALCEEHTAPRLVSTSPVPAVDTSRHGDCVVAPEHHTGVDRSCVIPYGQPSEMKGRGEATGTIPDRLSPGDEMLYAGLDSPNTVTEQATRHRERSDNLFEDDGFEPSVATASPQSLCSYTEPGCQNPEVRSMSPMPCVQDRQEATSTSRHCPQNEGLGLDRQSCTDQDGTRRLRRRRSLHDSVRIVAKRQRVDKTHEMVIYRRV